MDNLSSWRKGYDGFPCATRGVLPSEGGQMTVFVFQILNAFGSRMVTEVREEVNEKMKEMSEVAASSHPRQGLQHLRQWR